MIYNKLLSIIAIVALPQLLTASNRPFNKQQYDTRYEQLTQGVHLLPSQPCSPAKAPTPSNVQDLNRISQQLAFKIAQTGFQAVRDMEHCAKMNFFNPAYESSIKAFQCAKLLQNSNLLYAQNQLLNKIQEQYTKLHQSLHAHPIHPRHAHTAIAFYQQRSTQRSPLPMTRQPYYHPHHSTMPHYPLGQWVIFNGQWQWRPHYTQRRP